MQDEPFDPYSQWLGLKSPNRPPNHYELLDLQEFESDPDAIQHAIDKQASILQMVTSDKSSIAEDILKDVGEARICLTDPTKKAAYDETLRDKKDANKKDANDKEALSEEQNQTETSGGPPPPPLPTVESNDQDDVDQVESAKIEIDTNKGVSAVNAVHENGQQESVGVPKIDVSNPSESVKEQPQKESPPQEVPATPASEMQDRIESQRAKEEQDKQFKVILDRVLWSSCGIALVAIIWVAIARTSGCNSGTKETAEQSSDSKSDIDSQKLKPRKNLDRSLVSPIEKENKDKLRKEANAKQNKKKKNDSGPTKNLVNQNKKVAFESIKQTIGFFDFNNPVNETDLLDALGPIRLTKIKWSSAPRGGHINLSKASHVYVDSDKAFDTVKALTVIGRFKTGQKNGKHVLVSIENKMVVYLENNKLRVQFDSGKVSKPLSNNLANNQWHRFGVTIGKSNAKVWLDGKFISESKNSIADFKSVKNDSEIGSANGKDKFEGSMDNIGFYWIELSDSQIKSQFAK